MSGPRTLSVVEWLTLHGVAAWTPTQTLKRRRPRSKAVQEIAAPIAGTFAFAPERDVDGLVRLGRDPASVHPRFSLLRHHGEIVYVSDRALEGLRYAEECARPRQGSGRKERPNPHPVGAELCISEGACAGLTGVVTSSDGRRTFLDFGGLLGRVEIDTGLLLLAT
jgi:hypothetical protein